MTHTAQRRRYALVFAAVGLGLLAPLLPTSALADDVVPPVPPLPPVVVEDPPPPPPPPPPPAPAPAPPVVAPPPAPAAPVGLDPRCTAWGKVLCVSKNARKVWLVENGAITMALDARFGGKRTPTREGVFSVGWKSGDHKSRLYGSRMPYAMFFSRGQAVHFSSDFARRGWRGASHGCVNLRDKAGAAALFQAVPVGTKVVVYK